MLTSFTVPVKSNGTFFNSILLGILNSAGILYTAGIVAGHVPALYGHHHGYGPLCKASVSFVTPQGFVYLFICFQTATATTANYE